MPSSSPPTLCLVSDDAAMEAAVRISCPPPYRIEVFAPRPLVNDRHELSEHGRRIVEAASSAEAVLAVWAMDDAPAFNTLCYHVRRAAAAPVIALTRGEPEAAVASIAAGADDALSFPISLALLQAKVLAYRRLVDACKEARPSEDSPRAVRRFGDLRLDLTAHRFFVRDDEVELTPREFALLRFLVDHAEALCTRDEILDAVWGIDFNTGTNMVDVYMYFLRRKLEAFDLKDMIQTVRGRGYRLALPPASHED